MSINNKYYVLTRTGIISDFNLSRLNKKNKTAYRDEDFTLFGADKILFVSDEDITYQRDLHYLSQIPVSSLYKTDKKPFLLALLNLIFIIITLLQIAGTRSIVTNIFALVRSGFNG